MRAILLGTLFTAILFLTFFPQQAAGGIEEQRKKFLAAEEAIRKNQTPEAERLMTELRNYPLYPYLLHQQIQKNISLRNENQILSFLNEYHSTPLAQKLRQDWLSYLAQNQQWARLVRDFQLPASQSLQCSYARALLETGQHTRARAEAEALWLHGRSRPSACDPVFNDFRSAGLLSSELTWQRIDLAIGQGQLGLARYLGRYLPGADQPMLDLWLQVHNRPQRTLEIDWSSQTHPRAENILVQGMGRLIREDTPRALHQWNDLKKKHNLKHLNTVQVDQEIALYLALRKLPQGLDFFRSMPADKMTPRLKEWHVRVALFAGQWDEALLALERLNEDQKHTPRWTYWKARVLEEKGRTSEASPLYLSITGRQNYFSLLAADRLNQPYSIEHSPITAYGEHIVSLRQEPGIMRALELYHLERTVDARREWNLAVSGRNIEQIRAAALLAHDAGWHDRAIIAAANAGEFDDLIVRFPISFSHLITRYSTARGLDPAWVFGLARQESMFMADVGSPAGALGVMQIMPATGRLIASELGERFSSQQILLCPETNIRFGTFYLRKRLDELQSSPVLATAAYNAGAHRVRAWLPENGTLPADIWVENIPFFETRDYIEKVFTYKSIYEKRLGLEPGRITLLMPDIIGKNTIAARSGY